MEPIESIIPKLPTLAVPIYEGLCYDFEAEKKQVLMFNEKALNFITEMHHRGYAIVLIFEINEEMAELDGFFPSLSQELIFKCEQTLVREGIDPSFIDHVYIHQDILEMEKEERYVDIIQSCRIPFVKDYSIFFGNRLIHRDFADYSDFDSLIDCHTGILYRLKERESYIYGEK